MSTLITGGAGFIGSHMAWAMRDAGEPFVIIDRLSTGFAAAPPPGASLIRADIGDRDALRRAIADHKVDSIIHFAGSIVVPESVAAPLEYYENNTSKSRSLIEAAVEGGVRHFVFSSTAAVYGTPETASVTEDAPLRPESPYGSSKLMTEIMLRDAARAHGLKYGVLRYFNVAGADPQARTGQATKGATHLIKVAVEAALGKRDHLSIFGTDYSTPDGTCVRDYIHVSDLIEAHLLTLKHLRAGGGNVTLNCGYGRGFSVREVIEAVHRVAGKPFRVAEAPRRPGDPATIVANASRARALLGWTPRFDDLDRIVADALAWERSERFG
ncbi:MAG TPA: UDP-glucose 4-epimerase GalE, partial [Terricaulis sp.]|nr:UDP-glucose 4-epimerase GalE [Terricaulis sp.]